MASKKLVFKNKEGDELSASLDLPIDTKPIAFAIFAHCFTCSKNLNAVKNISRALNQYGFGVLKFDFTGLGDSEGDFSNTNFSSNVQDIVEAAAFLELKYEQPKLLVGHSLGGAAVIFASKIISSVEAVVTIGAPFDPKHVQHLFKSSLEEINIKKLAKVEIGGRQFTIKKQFLDDLSNRNMEEVLGSLRKPILIFHSPQDTTVDIKNAAEIYAAARHPKSFVSLDGADHLLTRTEDSQYVGNVVGSWSKRYIKEEQKKTINSKKQVTVQIGSEGFTSEIIAGNHRFRSDEPTEVGGNDFGPTPYDLLLSSLGACTAMTLRMYADRKNWNITEILVHLSHKKEHSKDCEDCEKSSSKIDVIERCIEFSEELDEVQKKRLLEIANKCPVHKSLHGNIKIETELLK